MNNMMTLLEHYPRKSVLFMCQMSKYYSCQILCACVQRTHRKLKKRWRATLFCVCLKSLQHQVVNIFLNLSLKLHHIIAFSILLCIFMLLIHFRHFPAEYSNMRGCCAAVFSPVARTCLFSRLNIREAFERIMETKKSIFKSEFSILPLK